jgi:hypothetical protein
MAAMFAVQVVEAEWRRSEVKACAPSRSRPRCAALSGATRKRCATSSASPYGAHVSPRCISDGEFARVRVRLHLIRPMLQAELFATMGMTRRWLHNVMTEVTRVARPGTRARIVQA